MRIVLKAWDILWKDNSMILTNLLSSLIYKTFSDSFLWVDKLADLTVSPIHQAAVGLVHPSRGISLRFPRFIRQRPDKSPDNANSSSDIADLFCQQNRKLDIWGLYEVHTINLLYDTINHHHYTAGHRSSSFLLFKWDIVYNILTRLFPWLGYELIIL